MKTSILRRAILIGALAAAGGCGGTYRPLVAPRTDLAFVAAEEGPDKREQLERAITDAEIANLLDVKVTAKLPTALAVARLTSRGSDAAPCLAQIDAGEMAGWAKTVEGRSELTGVSPVTALSLPGGQVTLRGLRAAAARMSCELLLVYLQADSAVENRNDASALYWTILGLWLVPGNRVEHKTVMQAALLDCRTGMILGTATGDSHLKRVCPWMFVDNRRWELSKDAPDQALASLQTSAAKLLTRTLQRPQQPQAE